MNSSWRLAWIFTTLLVSTLFFEAKCQIQECGFQGINLQQCLDQGIQISAAESCCKTLNQAIQVGYYCICKLIGSTSPLLTNSLVLPMPNCFISIPPLNQCQEPEPVTVPVLKPPPVSPQMPPEWQMQPSAPNNLVRPLAPKVNDSSLDSTLSNGSSVVPIQPALVLTGTLLLAAVLHVFLA